MDALKSEAKNAMKDLAEFQSELLQCKRDQTEFIQARVQKTIKTEMKCSSKINGGKCVIEQDQDCFQGYLGGQK